MKPISIIFLIVSVLLVIVGFALAGTAHRIAAAEGIELTAKKDSDVSDNTFTYDYSEDSIGKITVNVKKANINIIGGASKSYIELVNFTDGMYEFTASNRAVVISNNTDPTSFSGLASIALNFKGLRSLINYYKLSGLKQTVNIYLSDANPTNVLECTVDEGNVYIEKNNTATDYRISIGNGDLTVDGINAKSAFNVTIEKGDTVILNSIISDIKIDTTNGNVTTTGSWLQNADISIDEGDLLYTAYETVKAVVQKLFTNIGEITVDGIAYGGYREYTDLESITNFSNLTVSIGSGDITLKSSTVQS